MQTKTSIQSAQAIEVVRLIDGRERAKGLSPFAVDAIAVDGGIVVVLGVPPPLVIPAAPVVVVLVGQEQDVKDGGAKGAGNERVTVTLAGVQARHIRRRYDKRRPPPRPPTRVAPMGFRFGRTRRTGGSAACCLTPLARNKNA
jgi:hypothetical protein